MRIFVVGTILLLAILLSCISLASLPKQELPAARNSLELPSPADRIKEDQILVYEDMIIIKLSNVSLARYADTNSMDPVIDKEATGIEIVPKSEDDIHIGDIIVYENSGELIVHRVIAINYDEKGKYFIVKGDNNPTQDPKKVRFQDIKYILVGILY